MVFMWWFSSKMAHHLNQAIITVLLNLPMILLWMRTQLQTFLIKRTRIFRESRFHLLTAKHLLLNKCMKSIGIHGQRFGDFYRQYNRKWFFCQSGKRVIATSNGYIITNAHVINYSKSAQVSVITHDQKQYDGIVVGLDKDADLAVIKIEAEGLTPAEFGDDSNLSVGETVVAIGNPGGVRYSGSMTMGVVSAVNRSVANYSSTGITYIQTDTAINPGNSGGGLINMRGQIVGINTIKVVSSGYEGMGFSIPISQAKSILDTLIREGDIPSVGRLGITGSTQYLPVDGENYSVAGGVLIASIDSSSPLADSDLEQGDLVVAFNGNTIKTLEDVYTQLKDYRVGKKLP